MVVVIDGAVSLKARIGVHDRVNVRIRIGSSSRRIV